jgi:hypothetical protein
MLAGQAMGGFAAAGLAGPQQQQQQGVLGAQGLVGAGAPPPQEQQGQQHGGEFEFGNVIIDGLLRVYTSTVL